MRGDQVLSWAQKIMKSKRKLWLILFLPRKGLELSPMRSQFCSQNGEGEAGAEATCRDEKCNHFEASRSGGKLLSCLIKKYTARVFRLGGIV